MFSDHCSEYCSMWAIFSKLCNNTYSKYKIIHQFNMPEQASHNAGKTVNLDLFIHGKHREFIKSNKNMFASVATLQEIPLGNHRVLLTVVGLEKTINFGFNFFSRPKINLLKKGSQMPLLIMFSKNCC